MTCEPLAQLLTLKRKRGTRLPAWWVVSLLYGVPAAASLFCMGEAGAVFLSITTLGLLLGLPLFFFKTETSLLSTLRKGRCLEEMVSAGMAPEALVDTLAFHSLGPIFQVCLRVWPVLLIGSAFAPADLRLPLVGLIVAWPALLAILFVWGSYFYQARALVTSSWGTGSLLLGLSAAATMLAAFVATWAPFQAGPAFAVLFLATPCLARKMAIDGLSNPVRLESTSSSPLAVLGHRNRWVPVWSDNLIVARECARRSGLPGGLRAYLLVRSLAIALPLGWGLYLTAGSFQQWGERFWLGIPAIVFLFFLRSALRSLGAVVHERNQKTWEPLIQSGVSFEEFRVGWLKLATLPYLLDSLPVLCLILGVSLLAPVSQILPSPVVGLALCLGAAWLAWLGAYVGLAISAVSRNFQEAASLLMRQMLLTGIGWLFLWGLAYFLGLQIEHDMANWEEQSLRLFPAVILAALTVPVYFWSRRTLTEGLSECDLPPLVSAAQPARIAPILGAGVLGGMGAVQGMSWSGEWFHLAFNDWMTGPIFGLILGWTIYRSGLRLLAPFLAATSSSLAAPTFFWLLGMADHPHAYYGFCGYGRTTNQLTWFGEFFGPSLLLGVAAGLCMTVAALVKKNGRAISS